MNLYTEEVLREALEEFKSDSGFGVSDVSEFLDYHRNTFQPYNPWNSIESAPKDGSEILVWDGDNTHKAHFIHGTCYPVDSLRPIKKPINWCELPNPTKS